MSLALSLCQYVLRPTRGLGLGQASPSLEAPRLQALETRDLFHQHDRKGKIVMIKTSRYKGLVFGFIFGTWNWYHFWRRSWGLRCIQPLRDGHIKCVALVARLQRAMASAAAQNDTSLPLLRKNSASRRVEFIITPGNCPDNLWKESRGTGSRNPVPKHRWQTIWEPHSGTSRKDSTKWMRNLNKVRR